MSNHSVMVIGVVQKAYERIFIKDESVRFYFAFSLGSPWRYKEFELIGKYVKATGRIANADVNNAVSIHQSWVYLIVDSIEELEPLEE